MLEITHVKLLSLSNLPISRLYSFFHFVNLIFHALFLCLAAEPIVLWGQIRLKLSVSASASRFKSDRFTRRRETRGKREKKKKTTVLWCQYVSYRLPLLFKYVNVRRHDSKQTFKSEVRWHEIIWIITCVRDDDVLDVCMRKPDLFVFELTDQSMVLQQTGPVYATCSSLKAFQRRSYLIRTLSNCLLLLIESAPRLYSDKQPGSVCLARPDWV